METDQWKLISNKTGQQRLFSNEIIQWKIVEWETRTLCFQLGVSAPFHRVWAASVGGRSGQVLTPSPTRGRPSNAEIPRQKLVVVIYPEAFMLASGLDVKEKAHGLSVVILGTRTMTVHVMLCNQFCLQ